MNLDGNRLSWDAVAGWHQYYQLSCLTLTDIVEEPRQEATGRDYEEEYL